MTVQQQQQQQQQQHMHYMQQSQVANTSVLQPSPLDQAHVPGHAGVCMCVS